MRRSCMASSWSRWMCMLTSLTFLPLPILQPGRVPLVPLPIPEDDDDDDDGRPVKRNDGSGPSSLNW